MTAPHPVADLIAGFAGLHRLGPAARYVVALVAALAAYLLHVIGGFPLIVIATVIGGVKVWWAAPRCGAPMVADRFIGQLFALWALSGGLWFGGAPAGIFPWPGVLGGVVIFHVALLAPPIRRLGRRHPLLDDLAAGGLAALIVLVAAAISHGWLK